MIEGDDLYGDGVNVAARLEGLAEPGGNPITPAEVARICGVTQVAVFNWQKNATGPRSELIEYPGLKPRRMYSRCEVEAFSKTRKAPQALNSRRVVALIKRVEALERAVEALEAKP